MSSGLVRIENTTRFFQHSVNKKPPSPGIPKEGGDTNTHENKRQPSLLRKNYTLFASCQCAVTEARKATRQI
jgi:hypothetical protein